MDREKKPKARRLNREEKRALISADVGLFIQRYRRPAQKGGLDPNDRCFDHDLQFKIKRMSPEQLDRLMRDGEE